MIRFSVVLFLTLLGQGVYAQDFGKTVLSETDPHGLHGNGENPGELYYLHLTPETTDGTVLILMSGWYDRVENIPLETRLPYEARKRGVATLIPSVNTRLHSDPACYDFINGMIADYAARTGIRVEKVVVGGLSAGGIMSLNYAIHMVKNPHASVPVPSGVVVVDPPVDLSNLWYIMERLSERNCTAGAKHEADFYLEYCRKYLGGTPGEVPQRYREASPFSRDTENGGNARYLKDIPVRVYCEPDMDWWLARCEDLSDMNATDLSTLINTLKMLGNRNAEFIATSGKGYLLDGRRHPHSWSILDAADTADWIERSVGR